MVRKTANGGRLRQLQVFREVLRAGSERSAAKILRISQPAISQHIKQLEAEIGFTLFTRSNNQFAPTERAWEVLRSVDGTLQSVDKIEGLLTSLQGSEIKTIGLAVPSVFSLRAIPRAIKAVRQSGNLCAFQVKSGTYREIGEHVLNGRADIGVSRLPLEEKAFDWAPACTARNVCLFNRGHELGSKNVVAPEDIAAEAIIDIEPQYSAHQMNINALRYMGVAPDLAVEFDANGHDAGYVAAGIGISITNNVIAAEYEAFGLDSRPFEPSAVYHYVIFWRKGRQLSQAMQLIVEELIKSFQSTCLT
jgi:DNA-binding transcriptional LysR family regulator